MKNESVDHSSQFTRVQRRVKVPELDIKHSSCVGADYYVRNRKLTFQLLLTRRKWISKSEYELFNPTKDVPHTRLLIGDRAHSRSILRHSRSLSPISCANSVRISCSLRQLLTRISLCSQLIAHTNHHQLIGEPCRTTPRVSAVLLLRKRKSLSNFISLWHIIYKYNLLLPYSTRSRYHKFGLIFQEGKMSTAYPISIQFSIYLPKIAILYSFKTSSY